MDWPHLRSFACSYAWLMLALAVYFALVGPTLGRMGDGWDEETDARTVQSLRSDWLCGADIDPTQMRLQMYMGAILPYKMADNASPLMPGRVLAMFYGAAGICGAWVYGRMIGGKRAGDLAAVVIALCPYYLSFARLGYTESDMMLCALFPLLAIALTQFVKLRGVGGCAWAAALYGLCVAAKFTCVVLIVPMLLAVFLIRHDEDSGKRRVLPPLQKKIPFALCVTAILVGILGYGLAGAQWHGSVAFVVHNIAERYDAFPRWWKIAHVACMASIAAGFAAWGFVNRGRRIPTYLAVVVLCAMSAVVFFAVCPAHTANPDLVASLLKREAKPEAVGVAGYVERGGVMLMCLLFKTSPLVGIGLIVAPFIRLKRLGLRDVGVFTAFVFVWYFVCMTSVGYAQVFYMLPMLALLIPVLCAELVFHYECFPKTVIAYAGAAVLLLVADVVRCAPDYNLGGYQYLGARYILGHSTIGYTSPVNIPNDGTSQAIQWTCSNVPLGSSVLVYAAGHTLKAIEERKGYVAKVAFVDGTHSGKERVLTNYDYVISQSSYEIDENRGPGWPKKGAVVYSYGWYDRSILEAHFDEVFSVKRAFGIEVASVWKKKSGVAKP
jgi:hypothetical protein